MDDPTTSTVSQIIIIKSQVDAIISVKKLHAVNIELYYFVKQHPKWK